MDWKACPVVMVRRNSPCVFTFPRAFPHPLEHVRGVPPQAAARCQTDGRRFPLAPTNGTAWEDL